VKLFRLFFILLVGALFFTSRAFAQSPTVSFSNKKDACRDLLNGDGVLDNGSITLTVTSGTGPFTLFILGPVNYISVPMTLGVPYDAVNLKPNIGVNSYLVAVQDDGDPSSSDFNGSFKIAGTTDITAIVSSGFPINSNSCGTPNGQIGIDVSGGTGSYSFSWTSTNVFTSSSEDITGLAAGDYTVVVSDNGTNCSQTIGPITITEPAPPSSAVLSLTGSATICGGQSSSLSVAITGGTGPFVLNISGLGSIPSYTSGASISVTPATNTIYTLTSVTDASGCPATSVSGSASISVVTPPNAGVANTVSACNNNSSFDLFASLGGTPNVGGAWSQLSGTTPIAIAGNNANLSGAVAGAYTFQYLVLGTAPCPNATAVVTVNVAATVDAGAANTVSACNNNSSFSLFASLGGTPNAGGTWSQLSGTTPITIVGNNANLSGAVAGAYTFQYLVLGTAPCPNATAVLTVNVTAAANAGLANTVSACNNNSSFSLFASLGGTPTAGGTWSQLSGTTPITIAGNNANLSGAVAGAYTFQYLVLGTAPCPNATAVLTVNIAAAANAGLANTVSACNNNSAFDLFASLSGTPTAGGTWSQLSGTTTITIAGNNANLSGAVVGAYTFQYLVLGTAPCPNATAVVTVNVTAAANAGLANTVSACNNNSAFDLFASLSGTPTAGGTWSQLSGTTTVVIAGNNANLTGAVAGAYTFQYLVLGTAPCPNATAVVTVNVTAAANAGLANTVSACNNNSSFDLFASLSGTPTAGGTWSQLSGTTTVAIAGNNANLSGAVAGAYTFQYLVLGTAPCPNATAVVTVNVTAAANAGVANTVSACNNNSSFDLFASLGGTPSGGGAWSQLSGTTTITIAGNNANLSGAVAGAYTFQYLVLGTSPCPNATAVVTVNVTAAANAGLANTVSACNNNSSFDLFASLSGTPTAGGTWSQLSGTTTITIAGNSANLSGAVAGAYTFEYLVLGTAPCPNATAVVTVNVTAAANAGVANTVSACNNNSSFDLFASLGGTPDVGGAWSQLTGSSTRTITGNTVDLNGAAAGAFTFEYTVGSAPCPNATAVVTVNVAGPANAGAANTVSACNNNSSFSLFASLGGTPDAGGTWSQLSGTTVITIAGNNANLTGAAAGSYTFQYTVGTAPCPSATAVVTVNVTAAANAGLANTVLACNNNSSFDLFASLSGTPNAGGTWSQLSGTTTITIAGNNANLSGAVAGAYTFQYLVLGNAPCPNATAVVTVNVTAAANAGVANTVSACNNNSAFDLFASLSGTPTAGGTWSQLSGTTTVAIAGNNANLSGAVAGAYTFEYLVLGTAPCPNATAVLTVNIAAAANAGLANAVSACNNNSAFDLFASLSGTPTAGGTWSQLSGTTTIAIAGNNANLSGAVAGAYTFQYLVLGTAPCPNATAVVTVNVVAPPSTTLALSLSIDPVCTGGISDVLVANSELGVSYQLRNNADNSSIGSPVIGTGSTIALSTGVLAATTTFNVFATNGVCTAVQLSSTATVNVSGTVNASLAVTPTSSVICSGASTSIQIANSESGVTYQLRNNFDNSLIGSAVSGNGGTINLPTTAITAATTYNILADNGSCQIVLTNLATVNIQPDPNSSLAVTAAITTLCSGGNTNITIDNSEAGVTYLLRNDSNDGPVGSVVAGTGGTISLPTGSLTASTVFNILATGTCTSVELVNKATITVAGSLNQNLAVSSPTSSICVGTTSIIRVANSEVGVNYQLRNDSDNSTIGAVVPGTGTTIDLPTGTLSTITAFNVLASTGTCSIQLTNKVTITMDVAPNATITVSSSTTCSGVDTSVDLASEAGVIYQLRLDADDSPVGAAIIGNGSTAKIHVDAPTSTATYNILATRASCSIELTTLATVTVLPANDPSCLTGGGGTGDCATVVITAMSSPATCNSSNGTISFGISPAVPILNTIGVRITVVGTSTSNLGVAFTNSNDSFFINNVPRGGYDYTIIYGDLSCIKTGKVTVGKTGGVADPVASNVVEPLCFGDPSGSVKIDVAGETGNTLQWSLDAINWKNFVAGGLITGLPSGAAPTFQHTISVRKSASDLCFGGVAITMKGPLSALDTLLTKKGISQPDLPTGSLLVDIIESGEDPYEGRLELIQPLFTGQTFAQDWTTINRNTLNLKYEINFVGLYAGAYQLSLRDGLGCVKNYSVVIGVDTNISLPNIFTPNGDGINEVFYIRNLPTDSQLIITNRWGTEVYSSRSYQNDWNGGSTTDGVYYYKLQTSGQSFTGWVEILRGK